MQLCSSTDSVMHSVIAYVGGLVDLFSTFTLKVACAALGISRINQNVGADADLRSTYLFTNTLRCIFNTCSVMFMLASNLRKELPVLNIRVSSNSAIRNSSMTIIHVGASHYARQTVKHFGNSYISLYKVLCGHSVFYNSISSDAISCLIGITAQRHKAQHSVLKKLMKYVNQVTTNVGELHALDLVMLTRYNIRSVFCKSVS